MQGSADLFERASRTVQRNIHRSIAEVARVSDLKAALFSLPVFVKPAYEGASKGITGRCLVHDTDWLQTVVETVLLLLRDHGSLCCSEGRPESWPASLFVYVIITEPNSGSKAHDFWPLSLP